MERAQPIRPTQFVTTYGPGSMIETIRGPRLVPRIERSGLFGDEGPAVYEIHEPALTQVLPERGRIFRLPSNAEREVDDSRAIYDTFAFPRWSLCPKHGILYRLKFGGRKGCPKCDAARDKWKAWEMAREQAVSFVLACPDGHMDEVPWTYLVHRGPSKDCKPDYIFWRGAGGPLKSVQLVCPICKVGKSLADLYHSEHTCWGRYPETGSDDREDCRASARISQRASSDIFIPRVYSALTLPRADSELHRALRNDTVQMGLRFVFMNSQDPTEVAWGPILTGHLSPVLRDVLRETPLETRNRVAREVLAEGAPETMEDTRLAEFHMLCRASREGLPRSDNFQIDAESSRRFQLGSLTLRVTPVSRLRMVMAQVGYTRLAGELVDTAFVHGGSRWYNGVELYGEGVFLELDHQLTGEHSEAWQRWTARFEETGQMSEHPLMVWWHTLSHRVIRALAVDSGYSAASVRERLYLDPTGGGVLLYAVQPGGDGTLGGLIALVPKFDKVLAGALRHLDSCSNDPLCCDQVAGPNRTQGAACYACSLLSETACEMRNLSLDRHILIETVESTV